MSIQCSSCGYENRDHPAFCTRCGLALPRACPGCGAEAEAGARFCGTCGSPLGRSSSGAEGERKQLTVLFVDVQRSMELQENLDAEEWAGIMNRLVDILTGGVMRFGGTIDKFTGDGVMALFGAPVAQEDHARRGCHSARWIAAAVAAFSQDLQRSHGIALEVRLGLSSGEVVLGRVGDAVELDPTALGHCVGLAQRMESIADPGRPYLTEATARLVERWFELDDLGPKAVKGSSRPLRVYALGEPTPVPVAARGSDRPRRLVAREREWAILDDSLARALGGSLQIVGVVGEPGVGKSRLCHEWALSAAAAGITVRRTAGISHGAEVPLLPILALMRDYFEITPQDDAERARRKVADRVLALAPGLVGHLPVLFDFLEIPDPQRPAPHADAEQRMARIFDALRQIMERRSHRGVLVLLVEDLHWFDPQSLDFLRRLIDNYGGTRTLIVTNFRPEFHEPWAGRDDHRAVPLAPLPEPAVRELLAELVGGGETLAALTELVLARTRGNPFFVEEVVRALIEDGSLHGRPGEYRLVRNVEHVRVPAGVHAVLAARIDRLDQTEKRVLQAASVIGRTFPRELLARVARLADDVFDQSLSALCRAELLQEAEGERDGEYRFWHPLTQEVAYSTPLAARRASLHSAVAQAIIETDASDERAGVIAWHWERAHRKLEAARWTARAGEFAVRSDLQEGLRRWRAAAEILSGIEQGPEALEIAIRVRTRLLQFGARTGMDSAEAERYYEEGRVLAERLRDVALLGTLVIMAGSARFWRGDVQGALARVVEAAALADQTDDRDILAALLFGPGFVLAYAGTPVEALDATQRVLDVVGDDPEVGARLMGYSPLARTHQVRAGILARAGRLDEAAAAVAESLRLARPRGESDTVAWSLAAVAHIEWLGGQGADGPAAAAEALRLAEESGNIGALVLALDATAVAQLSAGAPAAAAAACERALGAARSRQSGLFEEPRLLVHLANARLGNGDPRGSRAAAEAALVLARQRRAPTDECPALLARGRSLRALGEPQAIEDLEAALRLARQIGGAGYEPHVEEEIARLRGDDDGLDRACRHFAAIGAAGHARRLAGERGPAARAARAIRPPATRSP